MKRPHEQAVRVLPFHPTLTTPVAAALVLAPAVVFIGSPSPVIGMDNDFRVRGILISFRSMPADRTNTGDLG